MRTPKPNTRIARLIKAAIVQGVNDAFGAGMRSSREVAGYLGVTSSTAWQYLKLAGYTHKEGWRPKGKR